MQKSSETGGQSFGKFKTNLFGRRLLAKRRLKQFGDGLSIFRKESKKVEIFLTLRKINDIVNISWLKIGNGRRW